SVPSITDVGVLYVKVKAENPEATNKIAYGNFFIQVQPAQVIVKTKQRYEKNAGEPDPVFEATVSGLVNGEPESLIKYDIKKVPYNGNYIITPYGDAEQGNYYVKYETHPLIIKGKAPLEISVKGFDGEYDGKAHGEAAKVTKQGGAAPEGTKVEYSLDNGTTWSETVPTVTNVADSTSVLVRATCEDFDTVYENYSLTVSPKAVTVKADKIDDVVYGEAMPTDFTATVKGTIGEDTVSYSISKSPAGNTVGEYTVTPSGEANQGNYTVSYEGTTFNVTESDGLTLTATGYRGIYDGAIHAGVVDASVTEGTTISYSIDNGNTWDVVPPTITNVGRIKVDVKAENPNYQTVQAKYFLRVAPKAVTVTADSFAIKYGEEVPELTAAVDGTIGKDKIDYTLTREEGTDIDEYAITFADPQTKQGNYRVSFVPGTLTIGPVDKIVLAGTDENVTYDGDKHSGGISSSVEDVAYEYSEDGENWTNKKPEYKDAGEYKYQVRASKEGYTTSDAIDVSVKISPKAIRIVSGSATKTYDGSALRNSEVNVYGLIEGEYFTVAAIGEQTEVGSSDNNVEYEFGEVQNLEATAAKAENYEVEEVILGTLTVNPAPADEPVPVVDNNDGIGGGNVLVATGDANGGVQMTEIAAGSTPLAGGLLDSHCCILHLLIILAALIMLFWYTTDMKRRQKRIFELEEEINGKE
ncbi:MAG: hypothetical protein MJ144_05185, partial [Clostridia bacterium]|nr:hypothetical protein [Clostridia bacterium]